jgi:hypothetical protein
MGLNFPEPPLTPGQRYVAAGVVWAWDGVKWEAVGNTLIPGGGGVAVGVTPPSSPADGALWFDSVSLALFIWFDDGLNQQWIPANT